MDKILYLTRHAQAYHNVADDYTSPSTPPSAPAYSPLDLVLS